MVIPKLIIECLLNTSHDSLGYHVGPTKSYCFPQKGLLLPRLVKIHQYVRHCQKCQIMNLQKNTLHKFTSQYYPNPTRSHVNWPNRTLKHYIMRQLIHPHCSMQPYRLPYDNPLTRQKDSNSSYTLVFGNKAQICFPTNIIFQQWERIYI